MTKTIAIVAAKIASFALSRDRNAKHQCFRIKNLHDQEIIELVAAWPNIATSVGLDQVRLLVTDSLGGAIPAQFVAAIGNTITYYRNHNPEGLIYVESSVQSDEQGLQNMFSLRDSNFLDNSFDEYIGIGYGVPGALIDEAWRNSSSKGEVPEVLRSKLLMIIRLVHPEIEPVPVRRFIAFIELACNLWSNHNLIIDEFEANKIVGKALQALELFPDEYWNEGGSEARIKRRLEMNSKHADLIDGVTEMSSEDVAARAHGVRFKNQDGSSMSATDGNNWRKLCVNYGLSPNDSTRAQIPYEIFSQLFMRDTAGLRLGDRVRAEIDANSPGRVAEFDSLDVTLGLNSRNSIDALRFIEAVPPLSLSPLLDLLSNATRKSVEKILTPSKRKFFNPAIEIVRLVQRTRQDAASTSVALIEIDVNDEKSIGTPIHGLFAFLFGEILRSISSELEGLPGACQLNISERLIEPQKVPELFDDRHEPEDDDELNWEPLPLIFTSKDVTGKKVAVYEQLEWMPERVEELALFWLLACAPDSPALKAIGTLCVNPTADGEDWIKPLIYRETSLSSIYFEPSHVLSDTPILLANLIQLRHDLRDSLCNKGLELDFLRSFLDSWQNLLFQARNIFVPDGVRTKEFDAFLGTDLLTIGASERRLMMPIHPIRLRWIASYMEQTTKLAMDFLSGESGFADGEGDYYLDWFENLTPREFPPITVGGNGALLYSRSEAGWWEDFSPLSTNTADVAFDPESHAVITNRIVSYLDAHPYKRDGLSLLIVLPTNDSMPADILERISSKAGKTLRISLYIAAPKVRWESISRQIEAYSKNFDGSPRSRIFPDRDLAFIDYRPGDSLSHLLENLQLDIALVTHVLQEQIVSQQNTEVTVERPGVFKPLQHRSLRLESGGGGSISLVMLPKYPDPVLESWSTLVVRANRSRPVAPGQPENTDLVELRINFQDSARLFMDLHDHCHWVITLERHISREQIESREAGAPDVLSIEEGIGANRQNTLVVSSRSGRELIHARLVRKLNRLVPSAQLANASPNLFSELADGIYESTRRLAPRLALQALGVSRATEEIVGLTIARNLANELVPALPKNGLSAWISLDDHTDWFGGSTQVRADMCRLTLTLCDKDSINVDILVIEGKLRQLFDAHGVHQVSRTCDFFKSILGSNRDSDFRHVDSDMWREQIASAIEALPIEAVEVFSEDSTISTSELSDRILSIFRSIPIQLGKVEGVYSVCLWDSDTAELEKYHDNGVTVLKSSRAHLISSVREKKRNVSSIAVSHDESEQNAINEGEGIVNNDLNLNSDTNITLEPIEEINVAKIGSNSVNDRANLPVSGNDTVLIDTTASANAQHRGLPMKELRRIYEDILGCFASHNIAVSSASEDDTPIIEGPASVLYKVKPSHGVDPRKLVEKTQALKLFLRLNQEQNIIFNIDRGFVTVDVPKNDGQRYFVDAAQTWARWNRPSGTLAVPIGEDRLGNLVTLDFSSSNSPHLLVAGTTGSGKSEALNTILFGLTRHYKAAELQLILVDPKGTELLPFENSPYVKGMIGWDDQHAITLLKEGVEEMQRRNQIFRATGKRSIIEYNAAIAIDERLPWWVVVLDEYADLTHDPQSKKEIEAELKRLAQKARSAGIHVIIATQKPSAEVISTSIRSNLPAQLALRVKSATESRVVIDESGAENLNGKGDALLKAEGKLVRVQCSRVDAKDMILALQGPAI
jgi:S-DNA-T family DNA segregation ATPase FtsK/SpoIIIE